MTGSSFPQSKRYIDDGSGTPFRAAILARGGFNRAAVETDVSVATLYKCCHGKVPGPLHLKALAAFLDMTADECRALIERSRAKAGAA